MPLDGGTKVGAEEGAAEATKAAGERATAVAVSVLTGLAAVVTSVVVMAVEVTPAGSMPAARAATMAAPGAVEVAVLVAVSAPATATAAHRCSTTDSQGALETSGKLYGRAVAASEEGSEKRRVALGCMCDNRNTYLARLPKGTSLLRRQLEDGSSDELVCIGRKSARACSDVTLESAQRDHFR